MKEMRHRCPTVSDRSWHVPRLGGDNILFCRQSKVATMGPSPSYSCYTTAASRNALCELSYEYSDQTRSSLHQYSNVPLGATSSNQGSRVYRILRHTAIRDPHASDQHDHTTPVYFSPGGHVKMCITTTSCRGHRSQEYLRIAKIPDC